MTTIGPDIEVVDEPLAVADPTQIDTCFLLFNVSGLTEPQAIMSAGAARTAWPSATGLLALTDAFFGEGGGRLVVVPLGRLRGGGADADDAAVIDAALDLIGSEMGPGQLVAPDVTALDGMAALSDWGWSENRVFIPTAPADADDDELARLFLALSRSAGARYVNPEADTLIIPGIASGSTREVPAAIVVAALYARNDLAGGHPNTAAAGLGGVCRYVIGIKSERTKAERRMLAEAGVNTFRTYASTIRHYGVRTAVDRAALRQWTQFPGSRTIMAIRAREQAVAERFTFENIDGEGRLLDRYEGALRDVLVELKRAGALFEGPNGRPAYRVDVSSTVNPLESLAEGEVTASIVVRVSPTLEAPRIKLVRRPITQEA